MDRFFCTEEISKEKQIENEYRAFLGTSVKNGKINLLEYTYLIDYVEEGSTIVNSGWFMEIINKLDNADLCKNVKKMFPNIYSKIDSKSKIKSKASKLSNIIIEDKKAHINFTKDQLLAISELFNFLPNFNLRAYGLYGYAGTGKTTIIVEILSFLLKKKLIRSVAFTAPTNKAVTVIKSKFRNYLKDIYQANFDIELSNNFNFDEITDRLYEVGVKIDFITIHKLLKFEKDFALNGDFTFVKNSEGSLISNYEIVVIDECSMISIDLAEHIFNELRLKTQKGSENYKKIPKVIFLGDPAQLPPVGENLSVVFAKSKNDLTFEEYHKILSENKELNYSVGDKVESNDAFFSELKKDSAQGKYNLLINDIISMPNMTLKKVMRSKKEEVTKICYQFRLWALKETQTPKLKQYIRGGVKAYPYKKGEIKTETEWFKKCMTYYKEGENCNIILTWTNSQADEYNRVIRNRLFSDTETNTKQMARFMVGDILMLSEFYNMDDGQVSYVGEDDSNEKKFYTSEQIKVVKIEQAIKSVPNFKPELTKRASKLQNSKQYESKYIDCINNINKSTQRTYLCWKLTVTKIGDSNYEAEQKNKKQELNVIYVVHEKDEHRYSTEKLFIKMEITKLIKILNSKFHNKMSTIETNIIKPLWNEFHTNMSDPFASVSYGYAITCHKGQGSNFFNAFVDIDDILKNMKEDESKKCLYTAVTRTSNELFLLS